MHAPVSHDKNIFEISKRPTSGSIILSRMKHHILIISTMCFSLRIKILVHVKYGKGEII